MNFPRLKDWLKTSPDAAEVDTSKWLTATETATLLGIAEKTLRNMRATGRKSDPKDRGPDCRKVAGRVLYDPASVEKYMAKHSKKSAPADG